MDASRAAVGDPLGVGVMDTRPFEAWALDRGVPSRVYRGETKGECIRVLGTYKVALVVLRGEIVFDKGHDATTLKALRVAAERAWRARPREPEAPAPAPVPESPAPDALSETEAQPQDEDLDPPRVRSRRRPQVAPTAPAPEPPPVDTPTATEPADAPAPAPPPPVDTPTPTEATCSKCHAAPPGRPTVRTRAGEESWCVGCRRQSAPRSARREAPPRPVATSGREVTITLPADSEAARALAVADRVGGVDALERFIDLYLGFVEGA